MHGSGDSLGKSTKFAQALPPGSSAGISALIYQDPVAMGASRLRQIAPQLADSLAQITMTNTPTVMTVYGEPAAIREESTSAAFDAGAVLVGAAIAIPNLLRSRVAANEAAAVGKLRTLNTAQTTYAATYPDHGYAPDLATLGPNTNGTSSADHAGLIDTTLGAATCTKGRWCESSGYRFTIRPVCAFQSCQDFVAIAEPANNSGGAKNFCSTSDGVVRFSLGPPPTSSLTVKECHAWRPMK